MRTRRRRDRSPSNTVFEDAIRELPALERERKEARQVKSRDSQPDGPRPVTAGQPGHAAEAASDLLAGHAKEAMRVFIARQAGVDPSRVYFPDLVDSDRLVELLTGLRHLARHLALDYQRADRQARKRYGE